LELDPGGVFERRRNVPRRDPEVAAILEWKKKHPSMGPAQLRAQLKRFMGWRLSIKAIARVLRGHGYALVHTKALPWDRSLFASRLPVATPSGMPTSARCASATSGCMRCSSSTTSHAS
jgi:hypothetical protein